jgi:hypothetical protein
VEEFVLAVSGQGLSVREIEFLARGYFRGGETLRQEIRKGNLALLLERMKGVPASGDGCSEYERAMLRELEVAQKYMLRVAGKSEDQRLESGPFHAQSHLLTGGILSHGPAFLEAMRKLHDRTGQT